MRVYIEQREKRIGLVLGKTAVAVICSVQFSEEELAIIRQRRLEATIILERGSPAGQAPNTKLDGVHNLTLAKLMRGQDRYVLENPLSATQYEEQLRQALTVLKGYITGNTGIAHGKKIFEL